MSFRFLRTFTTKMASLSSTPIEDTIRRKITEALNPQTLQIINDSHKHSHHKAMQGIESKETHFRLVITSDAFGGKTQIARHRIVNALLKEEMDREGGIHALQMKTMTGEEEERQRKKEEGEGAGA